MTIRETILAFLDCGVNATADQIIGVVRAKHPYYLDADDIHAEIQSLLRDRWLIQNKRAGVLHYYRRTPVQHAQLMAELDGTQPKLL